MSDNSWYADPNNIFKGPLLSNLEKTSEELAGVPLPYTQLKGFVSSGTSSDQWIRKMSLVVYKSTESADIVSGDASNVGIDLSQMRVNFNIRKVTASTPNILYARIYNLSPATEDKVKQFGRVSLSAGYQGNFGVIFDGTIVQFVQGKENAVDTYFDIWAGEGDAEMNQAVVNRTFPAGTTVKDKVLYMAGTLGSIKPGEIKPDGGDEKSVRSATIVGMTRDRLREEANATNSWYYIDGREFHMIPILGYRSGQEVVLTPKTGLIGMPQVTPDGIHARCLLNPKLRLAGVIQIRDNDGRSGLSGVPFIPGSTVPWAGVMVPTATGTKKFQAAPTSPTGRYTILLMEHHGDSRGTPWYTEMVCQAVEPHPAGFAHGLDTFCGTTTKVCKRNRTTAGSANLMISVPPPLPPLRYPTGTMGQPVVRVSDLTPALFIPMNRSIGGLTADITIEEQERDELTITEHPVEQGAPIADHAFKRPSEVTIRAAWSAQKHNLDSVIGTYNTLLSWQAALNPFQLFTGKRVYNDMLISSIAVTTDQSTEYVLMATITCRQIIRVSTQVVETSGVTSTENGDTGTQSPKESGTKTATEVKPDSGTAAVVEQHYDEVTIELG